MIRSKGVELLSKKRCPNCSVTQPAHAFHKSSKAHSGLQSWCRQCNKTRLRKSNSVRYTCECCSRTFTRQARSPAAEAVRSRRCQNCARLQRLAANGGHAWNYNGSAHFAGRLLAAWKSSAKRRSHEWQLTKSQLDKKFNEQEGKCALSGLDMQPDKSSPYRPSLDRIDSSQGYVAGNFQFVCSRVNVMKNAIVESEFVWLCGLIAANSRS